MGTELVLLLVLFLLNGAFAMSEIAVVSARRARLAQLADSGNKGARQALALAANPTRFLSSVQVGITTIGILTGALGEAALAVHLREPLRRVSVLAPHADVLALVLVVSGLTYVSLIVGELVPKRLALTQPERIASAVASPMTILARVAGPLVYVLSRSTDAVLRLLGVRHAPRPAVTVDEMRLLLRQGAEAGVFEPAEHEMMTNVLDLDERRVASVQTPRADIVYLDVRDDEATTLATLRETSLSHLPLCDGGLDNVIGFVSQARVLSQRLDGQPLDLRAVAEKPLFVPETMTLMTLLEQFKRTRQRIALVIDEYGAVEGLVSVADVVEAIVGDLPGLGDEAPMFVRRADGSLLVDADLDLDAFERLLGRPAALVGEARRYYNTVGGLVLHVAGRVPRTGDVFERDGMRIEVVDMDGHRVDSVLLSVVDPPPRGGDDTGDTDA